MGNHHFAALAAVDKMSDLEKQSAFGDLASAREDGIELGPFNQAMWDLLSQELHLV